MMRYLILIVVHWRIALSSIATKYIPDNRTINNTAATPIRAGHVVHVLPVACSSDCLDAPGTPRQACSPVRRTGVSLSPINGRHSPRKETTMTDGSEQRAHHSERPQKAKNATRTVKPASTFGAWFLSVSGSSSRRILARTRSMSSRVVTAASQIGQPKPLPAARRGSRNPRLSKLIAEPTSSPTQFSPRIHYDASFSSSVLTRTAVAAFGTRDSSFVSHLAGWAPVS